MSRYWTTAILALVALTATPASAGIYVKIDGIPGSSLDFGHVGEIDVQNLSFEGGQVFPKSGPKRCGSPSSKTAISGIKMEKASDIASPKLFMAAAEGTLFPEVTISLTIPASKGLLVDKYVLTNAFIGNYSASSDGDVLSEDLTLYFTGLEYTHYPEIGSPETSSWAFCSK
jgi:type VI protein secretion system component Hcp